MSRIAVIEGNVVVNIILGEAKENWIDIDSKPQVTIGYTWNPDTKRFSYGPAPEPAPIPIKYMEEFYADDLLSAFTADEFDALDASNNSDIKKLKRRLEVRKKVRIISSDDDYIQAIGLVLSLGIITQDRNDELLQGVPFT